jgi:hexosaminidase
MLPRFSLRIVCFGVLFFVTLSCTLHSSAQAAELNLIPQPQSVQPGSGRLLIDESFSVAISGQGNSRLESAVERFLSQLSRQTGIPLNAGPTTGANPTLTISMRQVAKEIPELGEDESYELVVEGSGAKITAPTTLGALYGLQTFLQLVEVTSSGFAAPAVTVKDQPRFPWRGLLIDVSRHFIPLDTMKRNLDAMAAVKMNVLHWHLSDDQGFRVESKTFPKLHELGSDGLYYTHEQIRELIAYAADRGIRVVPEFDMPGHSTSWFVGYPELASAPGPYQIERKWGIFDPAIDPTREENYHFLDKFIGEMAKLFPDAYFHIGGDEVNGKQWSANKKIQQFIRAHGLKDNEDLQAHFNKRVQKVVNKHGKIMVGWDEILHPELPKETVIQSWRGQKSLAQAAKQGYRGLLSNGYYLDLMWPVARHYAVDPLSGAAANLSPEEQKRILGGEACMWAEYINPENIDSRLWPRAAAVAERLWSPQSTKDLASLYRRLNVLGESLEARGLSTRQQNYARMLERLGGGADPAALQVLAAVVEPVKDYTRQKLADQPATSVTPLNRLIDAVPPESALGRDFAALVDRAVKGNATPEERTQMRALLTQWRDNHERLRPLFDDSFLAKELEPLSAELSAVAAAGLQALAIHESKQPPSAAWKAQSVALAQQAATPKAQLLLVVAPAVQKLIEATGGAGASGSTD